MQTGFTRLTSYIQGKNEEEMKIKMTAPVMSYVEPGSGPFSEPAITNSLYKPSEQQSDPPRPAESNVFIEDRAEMMVFVRSFDGFSSAQKNQEQLLTLASILREEGKVFNEKVYSTAGYNSPFKLLDRNNEVWLIQKNEPSKEREREKERKVYSLGQNLCLTQTSSLPISKMYLVSLPESTTMN